MAELRSFVCSSFEELEVAVAYFWGEREFGVDFRGDSAAVSHHHLDVFKAESLGAQDRGERVPCSMRAALLLNLGCAFAIWSWPDLFIARAGHVWLISVQLASFIGYLIYVARYFNTVGPLILRSREEAGEQ